MPAERLNVFHDKSGKVTVAVFRQVAPGPQEHFHDHAAEVAPDMVCIGGGATTNDEDPGALLTASYPNPQLTAWLASSKDHDVQSAHTLITYAIGLSIDGLTRQQLVDDFVSVTDGDSGVGPHPEASANTQPGFLLVGGGFRVDWTGEGNLATASFPSSNVSWTARSKDHMHPSPANIRSFAIGLREGLPVGTVSVAITTQDSTVANHPRAAANVENGFALTGGGADIHWTGDGNLLWALSPSTSTSLQEFSAAGKDHEVADPSSLTVYALGITLL